MYRSLLLRPDAALPAFPDDTALSRTGSTPYHGPFGRCCSIKAQRKIRIVVHKPIIPEGQRELMARTATAHADAVSSHLRNLNCSGKQKAALIDSIIRCIKQQ